MSSARRILLLAAFAILALTPPSALGHGRSSHPDPAARHSLRQPVTDQNFYFVMADRFDNGDTANDNGGLPPGTGEGQSGFDPTGKGWYHGGDLQGLTARLDYIKGMGTTAIWLTPSFKNKAVQPEDRSGGYHGYWITDFTQIDPHLGTNQDLRALVDGAHARGMKVYFDIITNHTADVIEYTEGARMPYVSKDQSPYRTEAGTPFDDRDFAGGTFFPALTPTGQPSCSAPPASFSSFPYHPCVPDAERDSKVPAWLNDVSLYHNRGDTTFTGENSQYGDFFGLDDLFTENPRVVDGMIDIYQTWIRDFRIDGFRMDTMKHVDDAFWQRFAPVIEDYARSQGIPDFYMFGEVAEDFSRPITSHYTTHDDVQGVLDFPFQTAATRFAAGSAPTKDPARGEWIEAASKATGYDDVLRPASANRASVASRSSSDAKSSSQAPPCWRKRNVVANRGSIAEPEPTSSGSTSVPVSVRSRRGRSSGGVPSATSRRRVPSSRSRK